MEQTVLTTEFSHEMGALLRSLESKLRFEPELRGSDAGDVLDNIERAIIGLVALHLKVRSEHRP